MKQLTLEEICRAVNGRFLLPVNGIENRAVNNISTDTRTLNAGDLFVPIRGESFDGHDFIDKAFAAGVICSLSEKTGFWKKPVILVEDTRQALCDIAMYYLSLFNVRRVGITGSVGKTTTKDLISSVLAQRFEVLKTEGNFNNDIGLPKTIFRLEDKHESAVLEMGMSGFGEISRLSKVVKPEIAVITNIGVSHIENLGSREGILQAKCEIFDGLVPGGTAVLNADDDMLVTLEDSLPCNVLWYGIENKRGYYAQNIVPRGTEGVDCTLVLGETRIDVSIPMPGEHMVLNALAAAAVGLVWGLTGKEIKQGIESFQPTANRMAVLKPENGITIINDVYNANPVSMKAAIDVLVSENGRRLAFLGDMFELGSYSEQLHGEVGAYAAKKNVDLSICVGEKAYTTYKEVKNRGKDALYFRDKKELFDFGLESIVSRGDICLVKASRGMHFEEIVEKLQEVK